MGNSLSCGGSTGGRRSRALAHIHRVRDHYVVLCGEAGVSPHGSVERWVSKYEDGKMGDCSRSLKVVDLGCLLKKRSLPSHHWSILATAISECADRLPPVMMEACLFNNDSSDLAAMILRKARIHSMSLRNNKAFGDTPPVLCRPKPEPVPTPKGGVDRALLTDTPPNEGREVELPSDESLVGADAGGADMEMQEMSYKGSHGDLAGIEEGGEPGSRVGSRAPSPTGSVASSAGGHRHKHKHKHRHKHRHHHHKSSSSSLATAEHAGEAAFTPDRSQSPSGGAATPSASSGHHKKHKHKHRHHHHKSGNSISRSASVNSLGELETPTGGSGVFSTVRRTSTVGLSALGGNQDGFARASNIALSTMGGSGDNIAPYFAEPVVLPPLHECMDDLKENLPHSAKVLSALTVAPVLNKIDLRGVWGCEKEHESVFFVLAHLVKRPDTKLAQILLGFANRAVGISGDPSPLHHHGIEAILQAAALSTRITTLRLDSCKLGPQSVPSLVQLVASNSSVHVIGLRNNHLTSQCMVSISDALRLNKSLRALDIHGNQCGTRGVSAVATALQAHPAIRHVDFGANRASPDSGSAISFMIRNPSLRSVLLPFNRIQNGAVDLLNVLADNKYVTRLDLRGNGIFPTAMSPLVKVILTNKVLTNIDVSKNPVSLDCCFKVVVPALRKNQGLNHLSIHPSGTVFDVSRFKQRVADVLQENKERLEEAIEARANLAMEDYDAALGGEDEFSDLQDSQKPINNSVRGGGDVPGAHRPSMGYGGEGNGGGILPPPREDTFHVPPQMRGSSPQSVGRAIHSSEYLPSGTPTASVSGHSHFGANMY